MPRILNFYMDDSGTRRPNRKPIAFNPHLPDFFALGGVLVAEEDEASIRSAYHDLCSKWGITYPLHSEEIRHSSGKFAWLRRGSEEYRRFMVDLTRVLSGIPVAGLACVIDRPGYDDRYRAKYGRRQWHLCQTAFAIAVERAAKHALADGRKLRVMPERSSREDEARIKRYFAELRVHGCPFDTATSHQYAPLQATDLGATLYELSFKSKTSPLAQIADLFLWPMVRAGYEPDYRPYVLLKKASRFIEQRIPTDQHPTLGSKYSCFQLVAKRVGGA
jgi:hypothetical protein